MSTVVRLPQELRNFLARPGPQTLLVRGPPGSGKTTLGLALLEAFHGDRVLVSSRVAGTELHMEFPWLGEDASHQIKVVDTSQYNETVSEIGRAIAEARRKLFMFDDPDAKELAQFLWLPPPLQEMWAAVRPHTPTVIVIDSWEALIEQYLVHEGPPTGEEPSRGEIERLLIRRMSLTPAHLVFVLERDEETPLDYLVNGVIVTRRDVDQDRLQRWMTLTKLRGVRIENAIYPYTLEGGKFESILPIGPYATTSVAPVDTEPDPVPGFIWPGSRSYAEAFGRLAYGRITLIEIDESASSQVGNMLTLPAAAHVLSKNGPVIFVPHSHDTPEDLYEALRLSVPRDRFLTNFRVLLPPEGTLPHPRGEFWSTVVIPPAPDPNRASIDTAAPGIMGPMRSRVTKEAPGLLIISMQGLTAMAQGYRTSLEALYGGFLPEVIQSDVRGAPLHAFVIVRKENPYLNPFRAVASTRLEVQIRQGRVFIHGITPWTPNFVLTVGPNNGSYGLLRVV
jgi:KaiC/GvpD/RAD55 family RecA-like ATPase